MERACGIQHENRPRHTDLSPLSPRLSLALEGQDVTGQTGLVVGVGRPGINPLLELMVASGEPFDMTDLVVFGCTDEAASNYDAAATYGLNRAQPTIIGSDSTAKLHFYCLKKHLSILISIKDEEIPYATKSIREMG